MDLQFIKNFYLEPNGYRIFTRSTEGGVRNRVQKLILTMLINMFLDTNVRSIFQPYRNQCEIYASNKLNQKPQVKMGSIFKKKLEARSKIEMDITTTKIRILWICRAFCFLRWA